MARLWLRGVAFREPTTSEMHQTFRPNYGQTSSAFCHFAKSKAFRCRYRAHLMQTFPIRSMQSFAVIITIIS